MKNKLELKRIGLLANPEKQSSLEAVQLAATLIAQAGREVVSDIPTGEMASLTGTRFENVAALARHADLILVFGGDGTILQATRDLSGAGTPILGINLGRLGFLAAVTFTDLAPTLERIWNGDYLIEPRALIRAGGKCMKRAGICHALNDVVISHGAVSRLIELDVSVNGQPLTRYRGDGLIISSPTGSTAYSLSAGGPIITPDADVLAITPICPHALSNRSVVVSSKSTIEVKLLSQGIETIVSADGQVQTCIESDSVVTVQKARRALNLLHPGGTSFFETLRHKLHWRGSYI